MAPISGPAYVSSADFFIPDSSHADYLGREVKLHGRDAPLYSVTTNQDTFKQWELERRVPPPPPPLRVAVPFAGESTYTGTYPPHALAPPQLLPPAAAPRSPVKFSAHTSYKADYPAHAIAPPSPPPPREQRPRGARFDATSSYTEMYPAHELEARAPPPERQPRPKAAPWEATTAYQDTYHAHEIEPRRPEPPALAGRSRKKFTATTTSASDYVPHALEPHQVIALEHVRTVVPFAGETENHAEFKAWPMQSRPPPAELPPRPMVPFTGTSSSHAEFRGAQPPPGRAGLGVAMLGDRMQTLIHPDAKLPATVKQARPPAAFASDRVFTTAHAGQRAISLLLYQGNDGLASRNKLLGQFHLDGLPRAPAGTPQVEVTFNVSACGEFSAEALERESGRTFSWQPSA